MFGNCGWDGCVIASTTNCAKFGWAISEPVESKIKTTAVRSRPLRLDEIAEAVELEIGGKDAGHFTSQGRANRDHRCADAK